MLVRAFFISWMSVIRSLYAEPCPLTRLRIKHREEQLTMMKRFGFPAILALLALTTATQARAENADNITRPVDGSCCRCNPCFCFNCTCDRVPMPVALCDDISCWFYSLPVKRDHQHRPRCCTPRPPEIPNDDPCPTRPRPVPLPGPSYPWPWLDPRVMSNPGS